MRLYAPRRAAQRTHVSAPRAVEARLNLSELQRTHGNAFVQRLVAIYRQPAPKRPAWADQAGWADARALIKGDPKDPVGQSAQAGVPTPKDAAGKPTTWNAYAQLVDSMWRIPIDGLNVGKQPDDLKLPLGFGQKDGEADKDQPLSTTLRTKESAPGRAIVWAPEAALTSPPASIDVMLHFHGFGVGYRQLLGSGDYASGLQKNQVRDIDLYQVPAQLNALKSGGRSVVGILAQGSFWAYVGEVKDDKTKTTRKVTKYGSSFGDVASKPGDYINQVFQKLSALKVWGTAKAPQVGGVIVSGHSGGGRSALAAAMAIESASHQAAPTGAPPNPALKDMVLFDAIHRGEAKGIGDFLEEQIKRDVQTVQKQIKAGQPPATSFRFRGLYHLEDGDDESAGKCSSYYCGQYAGLQTRLNQIFGAELAVLPQNAANAIKANYQIRGVNVPGAANERHERLVGATTQWGTVPPPAPVPAPAQVPPTTGTKKPAPVGRHIQRSPLSDSAEQTFGKTKDVGGVLELLRRNGRLEKDDADLRTWLGKNLAGKDLWLANKLVERGPEVLWQDADFAERAKQGDDKFAPGHGYSGASIGTSSGLESARQPIQAFYFPGQTDQRALIIGGVHGSELSGIEVANDLVRDLREMHDKKKQLPFFTTIVVPELFPESAALARQHAKPGNKTDDSNVGREVTPDPALWKKAHPGETRPKEIFTNRQFPGAGKTLGDMQKAGGPIDAKSKRVEDDAGVPLPLLNETVALVELIERFKPSRVASVHAHRFDESFGAVKGEDAPGIFVDPRGGFDKTTDPNFPAADVMKKWQAARKARDEAIAAKKRLPDLQKKADQARKKEQDAQALIDPDKPATREAWEKTKTAADVADAALDKAKNAPKVAAQARTDAQAAADADEKKRKAQPITAKTPEDDRLALKMAQEAKKGGAHVPGSHLDESGAPVVHYADSVRPPKGRSLGDWGPEQGITVITVEVEHYFDSTAFGRDPARAKELQAHADALLNVFLAKP